MKHKRGSRAVFVAGGNGKGEVSHLGVLPEVRSLRPAWPTWQNPISTKNTKISQAWWQMAVVPAMQEAEAGESLVPRRWSLQWAEIMPLHSSLHDRARLHLKKTLQKKMYLQRCLLQHYHNYIYNSGIETYEHGWTPWLTPVIPMLQKAKAGRSPEVKSSRLAWPTWWNPISTKIQKLAWHNGTYNSSYLGGWGMRIAWTWEVEVAVSQDHACTLAWVTEQDSV